MAIVKDITYQGKEYTVPNWVMFVAITKTGRMIGFATKPKYEDETWYSPDQIWFIAEPNVKDSLEAV